MSWKKLGKIASLENSTSRATTHMQGPVAFLMEDRVRVYFAARNVSGKSYPAYIDVARSHLLDTHEQPVMSLGPLGTFDDEGNMPACVIRVDDELRMYYSGWNRRITIPYHNTTGLAVSYDNGCSFERAFDGPILERAPNEPFMAVTPWVMRDGDLWRMWYVSGMAWPEVEGKREPVYTIKYADSKDGVSWRRPNLLAIPRRHEMEAMARPSVIKKDGLYHMWFCYRDSIDYRDGKGSYRIGYAQSGDGLAWKRDDRLAGIEVSDSGWDSTMMCYPYVIEIDGQLYMFYNGNSFGQTGIGCAKLQGELPQSILGGAV